MRIERHQPLINEDHKISAATHCCDVSAATFCCDNIDSAATFCCDMENSAAAFCCEIHDAHEISPMNANANQVIIKG